MHNAGSLDEIKKHPWFKTFDWAAFEKRTMKAPYVPSVSSPEDTKHFTSLNESEEHPAFKSKPYKSVGMFKDF